MFYKAGDLAKRLNVHSNTIRNWADQYQKFMSPGSLGRAPNAKRQFTQNDALILATIAKHRYEGAKPEEIAQILEAGDLVEILPASPTPEEEAARESIALIPKPDYDRLQDRVGMLVKELTKAREERDLALQTWQTDVTTLNARIAQLEHDLGSAQGELKALKEERQPAGYWLRWLVVAVAVIIVLAVLVVVLGVGR